MKEYRSIRQRLSAQKQAEGNAAKPAEIKEDAKPDPVLLNLPQDLCQEVIKGLLKYVLALCRSEGDTDFIPVVCKVSYLG